MSLLRVSMIALLAVLGLATPAFGYIGGGTFVLAPVGQTIVDNGGVVCFGATGDGVGGGCLPFPTNGRDGGFVKVVDQNAGSEVAFQVCIDNNGDGVCGGPQLDRDCRDQIFFSHDDEGRFFNPLGPLPTTFTDGCGDGAFKGYVVLLCTGVHQPFDATGAPGAPHTHQATRGHIGLASEGSGYGTFCGGGSGGTSVDADTVAKAYTVI